MGVVYKARQVRLNRLVALKMILVAEHAGPQELARFQTEAEAVARLQHPNIIQIYEVGEQDGRPFFSLEFAEGGSLAGKLDGTPLPARQAAHLVETLARAIHAAHQRGIIHRDLKPANVLLTADGTPKITDFGLAKKLEDSAGQTASGAILGTPSYMAPEQAGGKRQEVGPAADVYALGAILYELLTGRPPFKAANPLDTLMQVVADDPVPPTQLQSKTPRDLETICLKCLQKLPGKRYATALELADDLRRFQAGEPIRARPVGTAERAVKWVKRRPATAALLAVSLLAAVALLGLGIWFTDKLRGERDRADQARHDADARTEAEAQAKQEAQVALEQVKREKIQTEQQLLRAETARYAIQIGLAQREWQEYNIGRAEEVLNACRPDLRGWEHRYLWALCQRRLRTFSGHTGPVLSVSFSPDGQRLASASAETGKPGEVKVWDAATGQEALTIKGTGTCVAFSPDGKRLASNCDKTVRVWDAATGQLTKTLEGHTETVHSVAFSPDGKRLASAGGEPGKPGEVKVWDAQTGQGILSLKGHTKWVSSVAFSPDGRRLASASGDQTVKVWDTASGQLTHTLQGHTNAVLGVAFSPDGQRLASASGGLDIQGRPYGELKVWEAATGQLTLTLKDHTGWVSGLAFSPDGKRLASPGWDFKMGDVKMWDLATGQLTRTLQGHTGWLTSVAFSPDGKRLASASRDSTVKVWDLSPDQEALILQGHTHEVLSVAFSPDSQRLASASGDPFRVGALVGGEVKLWDAATSQETLSLQGHTEGVSNVAFSPDGKRLASASWDKTVKVWDAATGQETLNIQGHTVRVSNVAFSPDGKRLASASADQAVKVWDAATGQQIFTLEGHSKPVHSVAFSPDGKRLASASGDGTVKVWDAQTGQLTHTLNGQAGEVFSICFSPDGKRLASASGNWDARKVQWLGGEVAVWDVATGQLALSLKGHTGRVNSVCFSPDGRCLASGSEDRTVKVWEAQTGQEILTLKGHTREVMSVAFSPDGRRLASASYDHTVKVWDATPLPGHSKPRADGPVR
jgi:WD40 repeat protein